MSVPDSTTPGSTPPPPPTTSASASESTPAAAPQPVMTGRSSGARTSARGLTPTLQAINASRKLSTAQAANPAPVPQAVHSRTPSGGRVLAPGPPTFQLRAPSVQGTPVLSSVPARLSGPMGPLPPPPKPTFPHGTASTQPGAIVHMNHYAYMLSGDTLTITLSASPPPNQYTLPKLLLRNFSLYFVQYLNASPSTTALTIPNFTSGTFSLFLKYMYQGGYPAGIDIEASQQGELILPSMRAWVMGRLLGSSPFMNACMLHIRNGLGHSFRITAASTEWVFRNTNPGDMLRQLFLDVILDCWTGNSQLVMNRSEEDKAKWAVVLDRFPDLRNAIIFGRERGVGAKLKGHEAYQTDTKALAEAVRLGRHPLGSLPLPPQPQHQESTESATNQESSENQEAADQGARDRDANGESSHTRANSQDIVMSEDENENEKEPGDMSRPIKVD